MLLWTSATMLDGLRDTARCSNMPLLQDWPESMVVHARQRAGTQGSIA
jgi:hypothetical protein